MVNEPPIDPSEYTVDDVESHVESASYSVDELRAIRSAEKDGENRSTALEAVDEEIDALTAGPTEESTTEDDSGVDTAVYILGAGATEQGVPGVDLPKPSSNDAPETLRIVIDEPMGFAGVMFGDSGEHEIEHSMRVKRSLETPTNTARLAQSDPLHPEHGDGNS